MKQIVEVMDSISRLRWETSKKISDIIYDENYKGREITPKEAKKVKRLEAIIVGLEKANLVLSETLYADIKAKGEKK